MIEFLENLSLPVYIAFAVIGIIIVMAIIGYFMEKNQKAKEENSKRTVIDNPSIEDSINDINTIKETTPINEEKNMEENQNVAYIPNASFITQTVDNSFENINEQPKVQETYDFNSNINNSFNTIPTEENTDNSVNNKIEVIDFGSTNDVKIDNQ